MRYQRIELAYPMNGLEPKMSKKTLEYHYGKHYTAYVDNYNRLVEGTPFADKAIEEAIKAGKDALFNNAAQAWNHTFFFKQFSHKPKIAPEGALLEAIEMSFGSFGSMKEQLSKAALSLFGSGWVWLVKEGSELSIMPMSNASNPIRDGRVPILTIDVWEHAYYLDYQNSRIDYIKAFWEIVDWKVIERRF